MRARVRVRVRIRVRGQGRVRARVGVRVEVRAPPRKVGGASGTGRQASVARSRAPAASAAPPDAPCPRGGSWASRSGRASRCRCGRQARRCSAARAACALSPGTDVYSRSVTVTRALSLDRSPHARTRTSSGANAGSGSSPSQRRPPRRASLAYDANARFRSSACIRQAARCAAGHARMGASIVFGAVRRGEALPADDTPDLGTSSATFAVLLRANYDPVSPSAHSSERTAAVPGGTRRKRGLLHSSSLRLRFNLLHYLLTFT